MGPGMLLVSAGQAIGAILERVMPADGIRWAYACDCRQSYSKTYNRFMRLHILKSKSGAKNLALEGCGGSLDPNAHNGIFSETISGKYFFLSPLLAQQLGVLQHMLAAERFLGLVIGESGSGKTTLMGRLMGVGRPGWRKAKLYIQGPETKKTRLCHLNQRQVALLQSSGELPAILCDDAHQLTWTELKFLVRSIWPRKGTGRLKGAILFASPLICDHCNKMMDLVPRSAFVKRIDLSPLTEDQTLAYLKLRLGTDDSGRLVPFSRRQIRSIYRFSGGLPGLIDKALKKQFSL